MIFLEFFEDPVWREIVCFFIMMVIVFLTFIFLVGMINDHD